ncbi:hypothetical protein V6N13_013203 [Hibiscus sabdariffa]
MQRSKTTGRDVAVEMAAHRPVAIGTKGTVGSLLKRRRKKEASLWQTFVLWWKFQRTGRSGFQVLDIGI